MNPTKVCVTGVGGGGHGEQIVKALRLAQRPYYIVGTDMSRLSAGIALVDSFEPLPPARDPGYVPALLDLCRRHEIRALFHGSEPELQILSENREAFAAADIFTPLNPRDCIKLCMDKVRMFETLTEMGVTVPWFTRVRQEDDALSTPRYPLVLKPSVASGGSANTFIAQNDEEARLFSRHLLGIYPEFIAQEYVGTPDDEYTVGVLLDMEGTCLNSIAVHRHIRTALSRRLRLPNTTGRWELGPELVISSGISQGDIGPYPEVATPCEKIATSLGMTAACNIQCRFVDGKVMLMEINPRFSGTTSLRAMVGYNEPDALIRKYVIGEDVAPRFKYKSGVILRRLEECLVQETAPPATTVV